MSGMTSDDLLRKLNDKPFRPFRIKMSNNTSFDIEQPWMIVAGDTSAIILSGPLFTEEKGFHTQSDWKTVAIDHMTEFADLRPRRDGGGKRKRG